MTEVISAVQTYKQQHHVEPSEHRDAISLLKNTFKSRMNYRDTRTASHLLDVLSTHSVMWL